MTRLASSRRRLPHVLVHVRLPARRFWLRGLTLGLAALLLLLGTEALAAPASSPAMPLESEAPLPLARAAVEPAAAQAVISHFEINHGRLESEAAHPGVLRFEVQGSPGAEVTANLPGLAAPLVTLKEVEPGVYVATYVLRPWDRILRDAAATADLSRGDQHAEMALPHALADAMPARTPRR